MKRVMVCLLAFLPLLGCEALPFARELEDTMLVQVLGVDWTEDGVTLTAARDAGTGGADTGETVLSASGATMEEAKEALKAAGEEYVSLTHVTQLVLGAQTELASVLDAALREAALSQSATVWVASNGAAKELLERVNGGAKRLSSIELNGSAEPVSVLKATIRMKDAGQVTLPVLSAEGEELSLAGTKTVREEIYET